MKRVNLAIRMTRRKIQSDRELARWANELSLTSLGASRHRNVEGVSTGQQCGVLECKLCCVAPHVLIRFSFQTHDFISLFIRLLSRL